jgi:Protein of unknown function (DUF2384)
MPTEAAATLQGPIAGFSWDVPVDLSKKEVQARLSPSAIKGFSSLPNTNPIFGGETPLTYMTKGGVPAMLRVRQLVDARRGGR